ncbi:type II toxin-antitoxin system Phd/YefM family antitoxin [Caballeronia sp. LZ062]|uniref:type II toxin-antitoxin system Phd/YefM family antitoxin n=1 Tax=unclassified Caballeronia TaxID=2646786 RepID=UPI00285A1498|nr:MULTISPECIES: type II toxin-antitoxin system Phd/YefM family antitoxin [unclassified Caballeronia]MDR5857144.1 type II toxin-antitoxin system Phd/YefM family antitoxin [Caballeronia sp. LZ050]MDR5869460.1 type II toxin-antitoxin system Phd/YefM family antitoxin [Caballeronia sp. LZ062]
MMSHKRVSKSEFKAKALEYFRLVESTGESMIVTDHGKPVLEVRRYDNTARTPLEELRGSVLFCEDAFEPLGEDDWEAYR